jgi:hypothetical protein
MRSTVSLHFENRGHNNMMQQSKSVCLSIICAIAFPIPLAMAAENFFVKSATYSPGSGAIFSLEANIPANDSATVAITTTKAEAARIVDGLITSMPANVTTTDLDATKSTITVTIRTAKANKVTVSYATCGNTPECLKDAYKILYEINRIAPEKSNANLNAVARIKDISQSNAKWSGANLTIYRGKLDKLEFQDIDMDVGQTIVLPIDDLKDYPVTVTEIPDQIVVDNIPMSLAVLKNGKKTLEKGEIRLKSGGTFWATTRLLADLAPDAEVKLTTGVAPKVAVKRGALNPNAWHEAVSRKGNLLTYKTWSVQDVEITNERSVPISVKVDSIEDTLCPNQTKKFPVAGIPAETTQNVDLSDYSNIEERIKGLLQFQKFGVPRLDIEIRDIADNLSVINQVAKLESDRQLIQSSLVKLTNEGASSDVLKTWRERLHANEDTIRIAQPKKEKAQAAILDILSQGSKTASNPNGEELPPPRPTKFGGPWDAVTMAEEHENSIAAIPTQD